jgi:hypothetical protein
VEVRELTVLRDGRKAPRGTASQNLYYPVLLPGQLGDPGPYRCRARHCRERVGPMRMARLFTACMIAEQVILPQRVRPEPETQEES